MFKSVLGIFEKSIGGFGKVRECVVMFFLFYIMGYELMFENLICKVFLGIDDICIMRGVCIVFDLSFRGYFFMIV